jgi:phage tail sheath gpL-like
VTLPIPGLPNSRKTPGVFIAVNLGTSPSGASQSPRRGLLYANKITANLTGATPNFTVAAGTQPDATPIEVFDPDTAAALFGRGSEAHRMVKAFLAQAPNQSVTVVTTAEAGTKAAATLTFVNAATGAATLRLVLMGTIVDTTVANGDAIATISANVAQNILNNPDLPVTAQFAAGVTTITAKHGGTRGNDLLFQAMWISTAGVATPITLSAISSGVGTTAQLAGTGVASQGASGNVFNLGNGATDDVLTTALTAVAATQYHLQACAHRVSTQLDAILTQITSMAGITTQLRQQLVAAFTGTQGSVTTLATGRNNPRCQIVFHPVSPTPCEEVAAQQAAYRLFGDNAAGGVVVGEGSNPACNLIGGRHVGTLAQANVNDRLTPGAIETCLNNGITPLDWVGNGPRVACVRSITTRSTANSAPNYSVLSTFNVTVPDYVADDLRADIGSFFAAAKLGADLADGTPPRAPNVTTPKALRARVATKLKGYEADAILTDVDLNMPNLIVQPNAGVPGRVDMFVPCEPLPDLAIVGGIVSQIGGG